MASLVRVRRRRRAFSAAAAMAAAVSLARPALAIPLLFTFSGGENGSFQVDSNPTPNYLDATSFATPIAAATGDFSGAGGAEFYLPSGGGGLALYAGPGASTFIGLDGPQLFTGALATPVFAPGIFHLQDPSSLAATSLTVTGPGAPMAEFATGWLAAAAAFAAIGLTRLRWRRAAA